MADRIAHQRPTLQDQKARQKRAGRGDDQRNPESILHERELEWLKEGLDHAALPLFNAPMSVGSCLGAGDAGMAVMLAVPDGSEGWAARIA
ncbi:hypothetical protein, partial [Tabrizicola caldifontis]|uniref:hypothetical protein n=1 Tax=Tabrizicola caldifontis TaxID=2528036 RepID=UPI001F111889